MTHRLPCFTLRRPFLTVLGLGLLVGLTILDASAAPPAPVAPIISAATRFTNNGNGTVTDSVTGLIWLKNANCFGVQTWINALSLVNGLTSGNCGLTDGSTAGQWRLPNRNELQSLIDYTRSSPALLDSHSFDNVQNNRYRSSTSAAAAPSFYAWGVSLELGEVSAGLKTSAFSYVWPVRGGQ